METSLPARSSLRSHGWAGIGFVVTFVVGVMLASSGPTLKDPDATIRAWYDDGGHRAMNIIGGFALVVAALLFVWFLLGLRERLRAAGNTSGTARETMTLVAGLLFVVMVLAAAGAFISVSGALQFGDAPLPAADTLRFGGAQGGFPFLLVAGMVPASVFLFLVNRDAARVGAWPRGLAILGYVAGVGALLAVFFIPLLLFAIWVLITGIVMARG